MRLFALSVSGIALVLLMGLALIVREPPPWAPAANLADDSLVPPSADVVKAHSQPDTLAPRPLTVALDLPVPSSLRWRTGVAISDQNPLYYDWSAHRPGWYLNWRVNLEYADGPFGLWATPIMQSVPVSLGMEFTPMVRMHNGKLSPDPATLRQLAAGHRGLTWLIGNEPDVKWQDNTPPEVYAIAYHHAYTAIKAGDPTAQVAIAGLSQITPLRLEYLERMWNFYQRLYGVEMPVDIWNMHAFVLREERSSWGVNIPPGFPITQRGMLWEVEDHADLALVEGQIRAMRQWLKTHGQQEKPLWITEYGILMPADYGFTPDKVSQFMVDSFDLFNSLRDPTLGYAADDHRLVQRWNWYSARDTRYAADNLFDNFGRQTAVGAALDKYLQDHSDN